MGVAITTSPSSANGTGQATGTRNIESRSRAGLNVESSVPSESSAADIASSRTAYLLVGASGRSKTSAEVPGGALVRSEMTATVLASTPKECALRSTGFVGDSPEYR